MKKLFTILFILFLSPCFLKVVHAQPTYYVQKGNSIIKVENSDPAKVKVLEWQVRLYKQEASKIGNSYWTTIEGKTANDVMSKLKLIYHN